jgi:uncharacterized protein YjiS (DUF1127 family)
MSQTLPFGHDEFCTCHHRAAAAPASLAWRSIAFRTTQLVHGWLQRSQQRRNLRELDDRALRDIGLSRAEVNLEADKPFWI